LLTKSFFFPVKKFRKILSQWSIENFKLPRQPEERTVVERQIESVCVCLRLEKEREGESRNGLEKLCVREEVVYV
jgi:hypothetical protein